MRRKFLLTVMTLSLLFCAMGAGDLYAQTEVATSDALQTALNSDGEVKLINNITVDATVTVAESVTATLDLNGFVITGTMHKSNGGVIKNNGSLTLIGGTIKSTADNGGSALVNSGEAIVNNVTLIGAPNAGESWPAYTVNNTGVMSIINSELTSYHGTIASYGEGAVVTMTDTDIDMSGIAGFTNHAIYTYNNGAAVVYSGNIANNATDQNNTGGSVINGAVTIYGGNFNGRVEEYYGRPVIYAGTFKHGETNLNVSKYVAEGCEYNDGVVTAPEGYIFTAEQLKTALQKSGTYTLGADITVTEQIEVPFLSGDYKPVEIALNLNGHKIIADGKIYPINNNGNLTINDIEGNTGGIEGLGLLNGKDGASGNTRSAAASLTINGGTYKNLFDEGAALYAHLGSITINGGRFIGKHAAVWNENANYINISGGYFEGDYAAIINEKYIKFDNGELNGLYLGENGYSCVVSDDVIVYEARIIKNSGYTSYKTLEDAVEGATDGDVITIITNHNGSYKVPSGKNITITGADVMPFIKEMPKEPIKFANIGAHNMNGASMTFNNVTFEYAETSTYKGLQHSNELTYNNCTFNGQVFLYGVKETFNKCIFNTKDSNNYNVWTYGAKEVAFNECTFNSAGKSVLIYAEGASIFNNVAVTKCTFNASAQVEGKAAIEMDSSRTAGINLTIDGETTATGFGSGNVSGNSLWNNKMGNNNDANNDITVKVAGETVLEPVYVAKIGEEGHRTLQEAIDAAVAGDNTIQLLADITGDVTITQKEGVNIVINGNKAENENYTFTGVMTVFGDGRQNGAETLKIQNINFIAKNGATSCIVSPDRIAQNPPKYSYSHNVTVDNCTFTDLDGTVDCAAIRQEDGGDKNLTVTNCTVDATMHSLLQVNNVEGKLTLTGCTVKSKNGINLNSCTNVEMTGCNFDVQGYALRSGVKTGGNLGVAKTYVLENNTLMSACDDGDAVIMFRASSVDANFSMKENVVSGTTHISGNTAATNIAADENYWDGKEAPVVAEGSAPIVVNSYYSDAALTNLVRNEMGSIYAFVSSDRIFGDVTTNAKESIKIEIIGKDGNLIGTSSLENLSYATGFNKQLTWRINLGDDDSDSWAMAWEVGYPSINNMPAKVKLYVDDAAVAEAEIRYTADGDGKSPVFAAKTNAEGKINSFIACTGEYNLNNAANKLVSASADGDNIAILVAGTYNVPTGKDLTITGAVENVKFDMSNAVGIYSSMTFNNVTFEYGNANYKGLQHAGTMVYNNCTINGQVFLYGTSETFNNCTFNQNSADAYNVWTYGAAKVTFNGCTFNSAGKSVLIYAEGANIFNDVTVTGCTFKASEAVEGKAAIEMDSSLTAGINLTIDGETTATGFGSGNVSGNSLWNNKMGNDDDANNDITVVVAGETVLVPKYEAQIGDKKFRNLEDAFAAVTDNTTLIIFEGEYDNALSINKSNVTVIGDGEVKLKGVPSLKGTNYNVENIDFVYSTGSTNLSGSGLIKDCSFTATAVDGNNFRYCYGTKDAMITFENCVLNAPMWAIHFDSAPGLDLVLTDCEINGRVALGGDLGSLAATGTTFENGYVNVWGTEDGATFTESIFVDVPYIFTGYDADNIVKFNDCEVTVGSDTSDVVSIIHGGIDNANALIYVDDVLMTGVAAVDNMHYATFEEALEAINDDVTLKLLKDIDIEEPITITKNNVTLDGNGKKLTYTGTDRAIDVPNNANANIDVTIKNLDVVATAANRGINYNENGTLNVDNVTVTIGENVDGYAINFPGMADNAQVTIKDSKLTSRNPLNIWGENMVINVYDSEIISVENSTTYDYAAIQLNNDNYGNVANGTVVNVYRGTITALNDNDEPSNVVANATETGVVNISDETVVTGKVLNYVANIAGVYFGSLQAAVNAIDEYGYNSPIVIMKSFATSETATVKNDLNVTIDLNGKTITVTDNTTKNFEAIKNQGTLTIKDSSADKTGKITVTATTNSGWNRYSAVIANTVGGKLTVDGGTLEHLGGTDMAYAIDNLTNGQGTYAETIINGGTMKSPYRAIRQFLNGIEAQNILTVNGGTIEGANKSIWMQDPNKNANTGTLTVGENAQLKGDVYLYVTDGSTSWPVEVSIAAEALKGESTVMTANLPVGVDVQNINGTYGVVKVVAQIDGTYYQTFEAALNAVQNGETITVLNVVGSENKELDFTKDITFTITGNAPNYALPVVTFQNATVNISNAEILIPELDARQNATINVINSTVYDAGGNSIAKSYYNGAINISGSSVVYMMQVTTMGYINISGTAKLHATWQTNVYGNGLVTIKDNATFNTAALHLTGQDYSGRDNTDLERVGKPAEIVVDGANFTVGNVKSSNDADYSYNSSKGINVGTVEGKSAILNIKNGGNVNIYMANGETANIGAGGTVNIAASTLNTICRAENGTVTLANNGTVYVTGAANLAAANVTGNGWFYMNGVTLDADTKLLGAKVRFASGTNNIDGSTINDGFFQVGIGAYNGTDANVDTENGVIVNVKYAVVGANDDTYAGWAGTGFYDTDAEKVAAMTDAKYVLNIENSIAEFGYLHVSNDGELNVNGNATEKAWYNNSDYSFYAGDFIINGTATFDATDVLAIYTKVSCDNGTDYPGTLNIVNGTDYEAERHNGAVAGLNFDIRKTGVANVAEGANLHVGEPASIAAGATMNIGGTATVLGELTNNGTINFTSETATLTVPTTGLEVNNKTDNNDIKVVYENGTYKFIDKHYVAEIVGGAKYESLAEAVTAAQDGETIQLLWAQDDAPIEMAASLYGKSVTIKGTATVDWSKGFLFVGRGGAGNATLIFDGANLTSASNSASYGIHVSGREKDTDNKYDGTVKIKNSIIELDYLINKGTMTLDNSTLTVKNGFAVGGRPANETESGVDATATMTLSNNSKVVVNNHNGMGLGYEAIGVMDINSGSTFETTQNFLITAKGTMNVDETSKIVNTNNSWINNKGVIKFNGSTLKDNYIDSKGVTEFAGTIKFEGNNSVITDNIEGSPFELIVNKGATLLISRFVLGYERAITVYGEIANAHEFNPEGKIPSLKFNNPSGVSVGGTDTGRLTAKDAYLEFDNSSWKNSEAEHIWSFENCYVSATSFGNNNAQGSTTSTWNVTFNSSVLAAKNYIKNGVGVTYNFTNGSVATTGSLRIDGTLNVDANSSVTTTGQQNNVQNAVDEHGGINGTINIAGTLTIGSNAATQLEVLGGEVNVNGGTINLGDNTLTLDEDSKLRSYGNIYGAITAAAGADIELTGGIYTQDVNNFCHADYDAIAMGDGKWIVVQVSGTQTRELPDAGWYWFSTYITYNNEETALDNLQAALGSNASLIKGQNAFTQYLNYNGTNFWTSDLTTLSTAQMYMIKTKADNVTVNLTGSFEDYANTNIELKQGWNWIGYPINEEMNLNVAIPNATDGDIIKGKGDYLYNEYYENLDLGDGETFTGWVFDDFTMKPGEGYMYKSKDNKSFTYSTGNNNKSRSTLNTVDYNGDNHWFADATQYPNNMNIVAMMSIDGEIVKGNYEVAAFANGECRGSARPIYIEALDAYVLYMTIHGEDVAELTFKYYDVNYGTEYELDNRLTYSSDAIVGSLKDPYIFSMNILGIGENSIDNINIYPNPTTTGKEINLQAMCDKVEVFNALGVKVAEYTNVDSIDAIETAGIYVIRVTIDGNARNCRLVVR